MSIGAADECADAVNQAALRPGRGGVEGRNAPEVGDETVGPGEAAAVGEGDGEGLPAPAWR